MDSETRAFVRHLFAEITARLEAVAALAAERQGAARRAGQDLDLVADLEASLADTGFLVAAIKLLLSRREKPRSGSVKGRRRKSRGQ